MTHVRTLLSHSSKVLTALLAAALIFTWTTQADATHEPANKTTATASETEEVGHNETKAILHERIKVSSQRDLVLQLSAECSILTALATHNGQNEDSQAGQIRMFIEIDGTPVPVSKEDTDKGRVVFCNREYARRVTPEEGEDDDEIDRDEDYIRTRSSNAFNWLALDGGTRYDSPANGNNILDVVVYAEYFRSNPCTEDSLFGQSCAHAIVGNRSLIIETTNASNHEEAAGGEAEPAPQPSSSPPPCELPFCVLED